MAEGAKKPTEPTTPTTIHHCALHPLGFGPVPDFEKLRSMFHNRGRFCCWKAVEKTKPDGTTRINKIPYNGVGNMIATTKPQQWLTFEEAVQLYLSCPGEFNGIGILIEKGLGLIFGDIDKSTKWPEGWPATYVEYSPSLGGLRAIWESDIGVPRDIVKPVELYSGNAARFVTLTGCQYWLSAGLQKVGDELATWLEQHAPQPTSWQNLGEDRATVADIPYPFDWPHMEKVIEEKGLPPTVRHLWDTGFPEGQDRSGYLYKAAIEMFHKWYTDKETYSLFSMLNAVER
ncbi:MAG: hypothetical protein GY792_11465, partial [Gammaproteobacteria bacterium]|nr:hypothetical protein [Gammaproteobacteria bacterium]